jgi:dihydrodipicolinate reductase
MKVLVIDGQGGKMGKALVEEIKTAFPDQLIIAVGTNSIATSTMLKAGADMGATGENPVIYNCRDADVIIGPIGIIVANSLLGEVTPAMAAAVSGSQACKILIPSNKCNSHVVGTQNLSLSEYVKLVTEKIAELKTENRYQ